MICSSVNRDLFIVRLLQLTDSTQIWRKFRGSRQEHYITSKFLEHIKDEQSDLFDAVGAIRNALVVSEVIIELGTQHRAEKRQVDVTVYLDSPLVMDVLGLGGRQRKEFAAQVISGLKSIGAKIAVFDHSVAEIADNLRGILNTPTRFRHGPTASALISREVEESYLKAVMHNPEHAVEEAQLQVISNPRATLTEQQRNFLGKDDEELLYSKLIGIHDNDKARGRDVESLVVVIAKRMNHRTQNLFRSKHIFITHNEAVSARSREFLKSFRADLYDGAPPAVSIGKVAAAIWLEVGLQDRLAIERKQLLASCAKTLAINPELIDRIRRTLKSISSENADQYEAMLSQPRYLSMSNDKFFGDEKLVTPESVQEFFDLVSKDMTRKERARGEKKLKKRETEYRSIIENQKERLQELQGDREEKERKRQERFENAAAPLLQEARRASRDISVVLPLIVGMISVGITQVFNVPTIWSAVVFVLVSAATFALGYFGIGYQAVFAFNLSLFERLFRYRMSRKNFDEELAVAIVDFESGMISWPVVSDSPKNPDELL
jgi:hypothetical protein